MIHSNLSLIPLRMSSGTMYFISNQNACATTVTHPDCSLEVAMTTTQLTGRMTGTAWLKFSQPDCEKSPWIATISEVRTLWPSFGSHFASYAGAYPCESRYNLAPIRFLLYFKMSVLINSCGPSVHCSNDGAVAISIKLYYRAHALNMYMDFLAWIKKLQTPCNLAPIDRSQLDEELWKRLVVDLLDWNSRWEVRLNRLNFISKGLQIKTPFPFIEDKTEWLQTVFPQHAHRIGANLPNDWGGCFVNRLRPR